MKVLALNYTFESHLKLKKYISSKSFLKTYETKFTTKEAKIGNRPDGSIEAMSGMEDDGNTMDMTGVPEYWPDGIHLLPRPDMGDAGDARDLPVELGRVQIKGRKRKRRRVTYNTDKTINTSRRNINVSEDIYYVNDKYIQTSRKYPLNCE